MRRIAVCKKYESELKTYFEERKVAALEDERRQAQEVAAITMSTESGCTSIDEWASRDEFEWASNWSSSNSTDTTPNKLYGTSKTNELLVSPTYQHNQLLLPPIQNDEALFFRATTLSAQPKYGNSQYPVQQKQSLTAPSQAAQQQRQNVEVNTNPSYSLWVASKFVPPGTLFNRKNVDIIDQAMAAHWFQGEAQESVMLSDVNAVTQLCQSPSSMSSSDYDLSPFDLMQSFDSLY